MQHSQLKASNSVLDYDYIEIQSGDNLWNLAKQYNMSRSELIKINNLKEPYIIKSGQKLYITKNHVPKYIKVQAGDNLWNLAKKYKIKRKSIIELNNLKKPYVIHPGWKLYLKK